MIRKDISQSDKVAALSPKALALFGMLIPHFNAHGKMNGNPHFIKGEVVPKIKWFTIQAIQASLTEISAKTNVKWFVHQGAHYIHSLNFDEHQDIREDRMGDDRLPGYSKDAPGPGRREVEVEGEVEAQVEGESLVGPKADPQDIFELWNKYAKGSAGLVQARELSEKRVSKCRLRLKERLLEEWGQVFSLCAKTPFLNGQNNTGWAASFDWIIANSDNAVKVLEGKYERKGVQNGNRTSGASAPVPGKYADVEA